MPKDGILLDLQGWDPAKRDPQHEAPKMDSPFAKYLNQEDEGLIIVEAECPNVSGEQRRLLLMQMIPKVLSAVGVEATLAEAVRYVQIPETREESSRVAFALKVGKDVHKFKFNVPPFGGWSREVMVVVLEYLWAWGHRRARR